MPIMIPDPIPDSASDSEKVIFETFKVIAEGRDWEVLYQVSAGSNQFDFVILMPYEKSVICLEVMEDTDYKFVDGKWSAPTSGSLKSPIEQTRDAMETLRERFSTYFGCGSPLSLGHAVVFNDGTETEEWLLPQYLSPLVQGATFPGFGLITGNDDVAEDALHPNSLGQTLWEYAIDLGGDVPYDESKRAQEAVNQLRTDLISTGEIVTTIATIFHDNLETHRPQLLRLTDDQLNVLQLVGCQPPSTILSESDNQINDSESVEMELRCVVDGAAGTGKTVLAVEIARQRCEASETVGLLCCNPHLSRRFERWAETLPSNNGGKVVAGTLATLPLWSFRANDVLKNKHQQRLDNSPELEESLKLGYLDQGWREFIGETIEDLDTLGQEQLFDYLIVDEAQNLCDPMFLRLMENLLKDRLTNGRWILFGDFKNQEIVAPNIKQDGKDALKDFSNLEWEDATLGTNCRNTHEIAEKAAKLVGIESPPMLGVYGPHVQIEYFEQEQKPLENILDNLILDWKNKNLQSRQIILLSSGTGDEFNTNREYSGWKLHNISEITEEISSTESDALRYSDVYDFQGLESDLAILVLPKTEDQIPLAGGLTLPREKHLNRVLYTGMSRAKVMLIIVADEHWRTNLERREFLYDKRKTLQQTM